MTRVQQELSQRDSELKTARQECDQKTVSLNKLLRKLEDEKSKYEGLK